MTKRNIIKDNDNILLDAILEVLDRSNLWVGTMTNLRLDLLKSLNKRLCSTVPGSPGALRVVLNRIINRLRARGVSVKFTRVPDRTRTRIVKFSC